jgi:hypothetical protein
MKDEILKQEIERIKKVLIGFKPDYFTVALCDHEWKEVNEEIPQNWDDRNSKTANPIIKIIRCKKCGLLKDSFDNPVRI